MYDAVYAKFSQDRKLRSKLLSTNEAELVEIPSGRSDTFWGADLTNYPETGDAMGTNMLGRILMVVRDQLSGKRTSDRATTLQVLQELAVRRQW